MKNPKTWDELTEAQKDKVRQIADDDLEMAIIYGDITEAEANDMTNEDLEVFERQLKDWYEADPDSFDFNT